MPSSICSLCRMKSILVLISIFLFGSLSLFSWILIGAASESSSSSSTTEVTSTALIDELRAELGILQSKEEQNTAEHHSFSLKDAASTKTFDAGLTLGSDFHSSWTIYQTGDGGRERDVHLALDKWPPNTTAIYAGFTVRIDGQLQKSCAFTNLLRTPKITEGTGLEWHEISMHNLPISNESFSVHFTILGVGHRLYSSTLPSPIEKDTQTIAFTLSNVSSGNRTFSNFQLYHPWSMSSAWSAEVNGEGGGYSLLLTLKNIIDDDEWDELFCSVVVGVESVGGQSVTSTPLQDYIAVRFLLVQNIIPATGPRGDLAEIEIRLKITVYNRNARYYVHV